MKENKAIQYFSDEYLKNSKKINPEQILLFLENFRLLHYSARKNEKSKLISIKIPESLLYAFKLKASLEKIPYQTLIKKLMQDALK